MAKVSFTKLSLKRKDEIKTITINNNVIEIKQYLPINEKLILISNVINEAFDDNNFVNPVKNELFGALEIIMAYTNISFTDKQKEDPCKLYDLLEENGIIDMIMAEIPEDEYNFIINGINECSQAVYDYKNSAYGVIESLGQDYQNLDMDATEIQGKLANPENLELLRAILTKLG